MEITVAFQPTTYATRRKLLQASTVPVFKVPVYTSRVLLSYGRYLLLGTGDTLQRSCTLLRRCRFSGKPRNAARSSIAAYRTLHVKTGRNEICPINTYMYKTENAREIILHSFYIFIIFILTRYREKGKEGEDESESSK